MSSRHIKSLLCTWSVVALAGCAAEADPTMSGMAMGNPITGEGLPNPAPYTTANWGQLPDTREYGTSAGIDIDPIDGNVWAYERCGSGQAGGGNVNCDTNPVDPIFKFDRNTGEVLANFGAGVMVTPHGIHLDSEGNVWVTDFDQNEDRTKGHQVHKFSRDGELLMSLGVAGQAGSAPGQFNQPNDVLVAPDGSIFVADGHSGQGRTTNQAIEEARAAGLTGRIIKFSPEGEYIMEWGRIGTLHGEFRTPHALEMDSQGRLWVADRGNHRIEIFDQNGNYLESRYMYGRISGLFITDDDMVYAIDSESGPLNHPNWANGVRIGRVDADYIEAFIPAFPADTRPYQGAAGEGVAVDEDGNVYAAEGPNSFRWAGGTFTKYSVQQPM
ncbi:MAG TPA: peptidyl-alpha-hydroxyglycine alpha-amidating lyase family protein [Longimicrobiales bacterium]|nr:peptidyl-alpha-hydroxyglycine alpha-amidating lyase family protein [Longimicrobiales bacterium]